MHDIEEIAKVFKDNPEKGEALMKAGIIQIFMLMGNSLLNEMLATKAITNLLRMSKSEKNRVILNLDHYSTGCLMRRILNLTIREIFDDSSFDIGQPPDSTITEAMHTTVKKVAKELRKLPRNDIILDEPTDTGYKISCINPDWEE